MKADSDILDCVVVGGGPGGLLAAIYLKRFHRDVLVVDAGRSRTRYIRTTLNCPGFPGGVGGDELLRRLQQQGVAMEVRVVNDRVVRLQREGGHFLVEAQEAAWRAYTVIAATGVDDTLPAWPNVVDAIRNGVVRLCAICDAYEAEDRRLAVFGLAEDCIPHACFLRTYSNHVAAIHRPGAQVSAAHRAQAESLGVDVLEAVDSECSVDARSFVVTPRRGAKRTFDAVYVALGAPAQTSWLDSLGLLMESSGDIRVDAYGESSVAGVYAIGDAVSGLNQISVAFGHAATTATAIHNRLPRNACQ